MIYRMLLALTLLMPAVVFGDVDSSVVRVTTSYQTCYQNSCSITNDQGSGVVIGTLDDFPVVATCNHVVARAITNRQAARCTVQIGGQRCNARVVGYSERLDLALLQVYATNVMSVESVEIEDQPSLTSSVEIVGFPQGRFTKMKAKVKGRSRIRRGGVFANVLVSDQPTSEGQSGGALFSGNRLTGIVFATDSEAAYSTPAADLVQMARHYKVKLKAKSRGMDAPAFAVAPPPPPEPAPPMPDSSGDWQPDPGLTQQLKEISDRLQAIEAKAALPGPAGPPGKDGAAGPVGPQGKDGNDANVAVLEKRLSALEQRGLTVRIFEGETKISEQTYAPGSPINLRFNSVK